MSASNQILDAVELLTENLIKKAAYDRTIQAQIISCEDETIGKYKCRYQDAIIYAYTNNSDLTFNKGSEVYILVPGNDMKKQKTILGTTKKLGVNYISQVEGDQAYDLVGNNCISSNATFYLNTTNKNYNYIIYKKGEENNLLDVDTTSLKEYIKNSSSIIIGAYFQTNIPLERQYRGHYGIKMNFSFYDNATDQVVIRSCVIDQDNMTDNPYRLIYPTRQYQIFDIDGANFNSLQSIEIFCTDFPESSEENNILLDNGDIIINSFQLFGANRMTEEEISGVAVSFITPQGTFFSDLLSSTEKKIIAQVKIKGKVASNSQAIQYYWGIQDNRATPQTQYYNKYLGRGWRCLNNKNIITQKTETSDPVIEWIPGESSYIMTLKNAVAKDNRLKVAVFYDGNVITKEINIQNLKKDISTISIESNNGTQFYYDIGHPILTCKVNNEQNLNYTYYWSYISNKGIFQTLEETDQENEAYKEAVQNLKIIQDGLIKGTLFRNAEADNLKSCQDAVNRFESIQRVEKNKIYDVQINKITSIGTFKCSVYNEKDVYLGTATIILTNKLEGQGAYSLVINNGSETFQYNQQGVAPTSKSLDTPQQIQALSFTIYDNLGQAIEQKSSKYNIKWQFPIKDTLLIQKDNESFDTDSSGNYEYYKTPTLTYGINEKYDITKQRNQIKLTVQYNNMILVASTNFSFVKQGQPGTNGTEYIVKLLPNTTLQDPPLYPMITYQNSSKKFFINYGIGNSKKEEQLQGKAPLLKAQLWKSGELIWEGVNGEYSINWEVLKNKYSNKIFDDSDFSIEAESGLISYNGKSLLLNSHEPSANIIKCSLTIEDKVYYGTIPIITACVINSSYRIKLKDYTGFKYVVYSDNGILPKYAQSNPFEFICMQKINNIWEDVSLINGQYAKKFDFTAVGTYKNINGDKINANLLEEDKKQLPKNQKQYIPVSKYDGVCINESVICTCKNSNDVIVAKINVPIHFLLNKYGLANINAWDGNSVQLNEDGGFILSPQVGAGFKDNNNNFTGILIGNAKYPDKNIQDIGLLGYNRGERTIFLNSQNGSAIFGKAGIGQIIIDPNQTAKKALLYSSDFWKEYDESGLPKNYNTSNQNKKGMIIDLTTPQIKWGNESFIVDSDGHLTAKGGGAIAGWKIGKNTLTSSSGNITLNSQGNGSIYSNNHKSISNLGDGFFISQDGLSIGSKIRIDETGIVKVGPGAVAGTGKHWTINGDSNRAYIAYGGETQVDTASGSGDNSAKVYLGTDGISLGKRFSVTSKGQLKAYEGIIGGWTINANQLTAKNIEINSNGSIQTKSFTENADSGWHISSNGTAHFNVIYANKKGKIAGWTISSNKLSANNIEINSDGSIQTSDFTAGGLGWQILKSGKVYFNQATIRGAIYADAGKIGHWDISTNNLITQDTDALFQMGNLTLQTRGSDGRATIGFGYDAYGQSSYINTNIAVVNNLAVNSWVGTLPIKINTKYYDGTYNFTSRLRGNTMFEGHVCVKGEDYVLFGNKWRIRNDGIAQFEDLYIGNDKIRNIIKGIIEGYLKHYVKRSEVSIKTIKVPTGRASVDKGVIKVSTSNQRVLIPKP